MAKEVFLLEKYRYSDEELALIENSSVPFAIYQFINKRVVAIALSKGFIEMAGYTDLTREEVYDLMNTNMYQDTHPDDLATIGDAALTFATEGGVYDVIYRFKRNGEYRIIHSYGRHITKENGVWIVSGEKLETLLAFIWYTDNGPFVSDGKNEKDSLLNSLKNKLEERSFDIRAGHDYLTGLPSMSYFFDLAEAGCKEIRRNGKRPVIFFFDFDGMKVFNQKYGLEEGDRFIKSFADTLVKEFSHENCSRFSGDHFCAYCDEETGTEAVKKIMDANNERQTEMKMPLRVGMYLYDDESISISGACDRAQIASDAGKSNYETKLYLFDPEMIKSLEDKQYVIENIDKALAEGWIKVFYQPIIRTASGQVCHEEALARWIDPNKGFFSPAAFIPALEEAGPLYRGCCH